MNPTQLFYESLYGVRWAALAKKENHEKKWPNHPPGHCATSSRKGGAHRKKTSAEIRAKVIAEMSTDSYSTGPSIAKVIGVNQSTANRHINKLVSEGLAIRESQGAKLVA